MAGHTEVIARSRPEAIFGPRGQPDGDPQGSTGISKGGYKYRSALYGKTVSIVPDGYLCFSDRMVRIPELKY